MSVNHNSSIGQHYLDYVMKRVRYLKTKAERAVNQVENDDNLFLLLDEKSNSIAIIMKHLAGNMRSRWTKFLTTDGEKTTRDRPNEFHRTFKVTKSELFKIWNEGWEYFFNAIEELKPNDLMKEVYVRRKKYSVLEAIEVQLSHYSEHIGQIIFLAKHFESNSWEYVTLPPDYRFYDK
ncbi:MAG: DUF1572 family protein [Candidatus Thorarchaeota archaeon]